MGRKGVIPLLHCWKAGWQGQLFFSVILSLNYLYSNLFGKLVIGVLVLTVSTAILAWF